MSVKPPLFIEYDGCINCPTVKANKERHGHDYGGFDHELLVACVLGGCETWGHTHMKPFYSPSEIRRLAALQNDDTLKEKAEQIASKLEKQIASKFWER